MTDRNPIPESAEPVRTSALLGRRKMLALGLGAAALGLTSPLKGALAALPQTGSRTLGFVSTHTDEIRRAHV